VLFSIYLTRGNNCKQSYSDALDKSFFDIIEKIMKILLLASYGPSLLLFRGSLIEALVQAGHHVFSVAPDMDAPLCEKLRRLGATPLDMPLSRTGLNPSHDILYGLRLYLKIRQIRPDLVLSYTAKPNIWGAIAASAAGIRSAAMVTGLGFAFTDDGKRYLKRSLVKKIQIWLYRQATNHNEVVIFQNPDDRDDFIRAGCLADPSKARMVNGSGVDTEAFPVAGFPSGPIRFLLIARLLGDKGVREFAEAAKMLKAENHAVDFHLVGPIDSNPNGLPENLVEYWHNANVLYWHGSLMDVRPAILASHVYVLPSYREGTPRTVLEAMSMGRPIITTDAPGCRETVVDHLNGFLVPVRDAEALADAMRKFIEMPGLISQMGAQSRRIVEEKYDVRKVNAQIMETIGL
jgi:glycosyltransferase involved in cell wall biosynthesis